MKILFDTVTHGAVQTEELGKKLAELILSDASAPRFVALYGDLGVGKTVFIRGFTSAVVPEATVKSPTFALVNEYRPPRGSDKGRTAVFHFDMYRIESEDDLWSTGFYDYPEKGICLVEWSENIPYALPDRYYSVRIVKNDALDASSRRIVVASEGI